MTSDPGVCSRRMPLAVAKEADWKESRQIQIQIQGVFFTGTPPKSFKYKQINLGKVRCI